MLGYQAEQPVRRPTSTQYLPGRRPVNVKAPLEPVRPAVMTGRSRIVVPGTYSRTVVQVSWLVRSVPASTSRDTGRFVPSSLTVPPRGPHVSLDDEYEIRSSSLLVLVSFRAAWQLAYPPPLPPMVASSVEPVGSTTTR